MAGGRSFDVLSDLWYQFLTSKKHWTLFAPRATEESGWGADGAQVKPFSVVRGCTLVVALASGGVACGPIVSGVQVINANIELSAAETAGAPSHAIYEYNAAVEYLQKAREEAGYSDFSASREFADKARDFAKKARKKAEAVSKLDQPAVLPPPK